MDYTPKRFTVTIRRDIARVVRPNAEQLEGHAYVFSAGWMMGEDDPYPGEVAYIPRDSDYPMDGPQWIASGDLVPAPPLASTPPDKNAYHL